MADKTLTQQRFDSLVKDHVAPVLKAAGFKKQGLNFRRRWGEDGHGGWHVINIQKSQWGNRDCISFTINLGVACDIYTRYEGREPSKPPTEPYCCWRKRIGDLMENGVDDWWEISTAKRFDHPADEIVWALRELAIPALDSLGSNEGISKSLAEVTPGKWSPGWNWNAIVKAVFLQDQPREQAKVIAAIREAHSDTPENREKIERDISRIERKT